MEGIKMRKNLLCEKIHLSEKEVIVHKAYRFFSCGDNLLSQIFAAAHRKEELIIDWS
ncbi:7093_t:CDS:2 [Diversispora eburnea]|uniref:7093_t:CDS:1 n=1 Tax=Diversispora eburnea TaxID=1213867 RepID=A0A9N8W7Y0_9GLOM|nr:7093_t:CDS:2 [Diversispora eburnea]